MEAIIFVTFPLASLVIVLFLLWNDMMRRRRSPRALYIARSLLCLMMAGVLAYNWFTWRTLVHGAPWVFMVLAIIAAVVAAIFFLLRGIHGDQRRLPDDEPLPSVFSSEEPQPRQADSTDSGDDPSTPADHPRAR